MPLPVPVTEQSRCVRNLHDSEPYHVNIGPNTIAARIASFCWTKRMADCRLAPPLAVHSQGARQQKMRSRFGFSGRVLSLALLSFIVHPGVAASQGQRSVDRLTTAPFIRKTGDMLGYELIPNFRGTYKGAPFQTNRWGMRDKDSALVPAP